MSELRRLLAEAEAMRLALLRAGHRIDAAAASIRIRALKDAINAVNRWGEAPRD